MLVLSRMRDQKIMIGDGTIVEVVDIRGDKVRLAITAPSTVSVHREEVYLEIQKSLRNASAASDNEVKVDRNQPKPNNAGHRQD